MNDAGGAGGGGGVPSPPCGANASAPSGVSAVRRENRDRARRRGCLPVPRFAEKPTPSRFLAKQTHSWEGLTAHVSAPAESLRGRWQAPLRPRLRPLGSAPATRPRGDAVTCGRVLCFAAPSPLSTVPTPSSSPRPRPGVPVLAGRGLRQGPSEQAPGGGRELHPAGPGRPLPAPGREAVGARESAPAAGRCSRNSQLQVRTGLRGGCWASRRARLLRGLLTRAPGRTALCARPSAALLGQKPPSPGASRRCGRGCAAVSPARPETVLSSRKAESGCCLAACAGGRVQATPCVTWPSPPVAPRVPVFAGHGPAGDSQTCWKHTAFHSIPTARFRADAVDTVSRRSLQKPGPAQYPEQSDGFFRVTRVSGPWSQGVMGTAVPRWPRELWVQTRVDAGRAVTGPASRLLAEHVQCV